MSNNNNQSHGITRKNMIKSLINTNKIKNSGEEYDSRMIINLIDNYNNYSKKVIHNIISNILNKEIIEDYEYDVIENILNNIFENIKNIDKPNKDLLYIDTILFIIDKLFLYGSIDNNNKNKNDILDKIYNEIKDLNKKESDYSCFSSIIGYITFYEESFNNISEIQGTKNNPEPATGNGNRNGNGNGNEHENENGNENGNEEASLESDQSNSTINENEKKNQGMNNVNPTNNLKIADIKKNNILKIDKKYILDETNIKNYFRKILGYDNFNSERKGRIDEKIKKTKNFLFQVLGYTKIKNIMSIVLFENITKVLCLSDLKYIENKLPYIEIINIKNISKDNIFNISQHLDEKFITKNGNKNILTFESKPYNLNNKI